MLPVMSDSEVLEYRQAAAAITERDKARTATTSLLEFTKQCWHIIEPGHDFVRSWHHNFICEHLEAVKAGQIKQLLITIPPGMTKSILCSVVFQPWVWTTQPTARVLCASYIDKLATRDAVKSRAILDSEWYKLRWGATVRFTPDQNQKTYYMNTAMGWRMSTSVGGAGTGEHPHFIIIDDPIKAGDADSPVARKKVIDWWTGTISMRGASSVQDVRRVVIMQRLHEGDLAGYLAKQDGWDVICLPMRAEPGMMKKTSLGKIDLRKEGKLLCPGLFDEKAVREAEILLGPHKAAGQLQQRPSAAEGGLFSNSMFRYGKMATDAAGVEVFELHQDDGGTDTVALDDCVFYQTIDTALKLGSTNDYTVILTSAVTPEPVRIIVVSVFRERIEVPKQFGVIMAQKKRWPRVSVQAVEDAASGTGLIQEAVMKGMPFLVLKPDRDKVSRAEPIARMLEQGVVYFLAGEPWLPEFERELMLFPHGDHDDMVDTFSYAGILVARRAMIGAASNRSLAMWPRVDDDEETADNEDTERPISLAEKLTGRQAGQARRPKESWEL